MRALLYDTESPGVLLMFFPHANIDPLQPPQLLKSNLQGHVVAYLPLHHTLCGFPLITMLCGLTIHPLFPMHSVLAFIMAAIWVFTFFPYLLFGLPLLWVSLTD